MSHLLLPALVAVTLGALHAAEIRRIPPPGIAVPEADRADLQAGADALARGIAAFRRDQNVTAPQLAELPNIEIFHKAVDWALRYDEVFDAKQIGIARDQLTLGRTRLDDLRGGRMPWNTSGGLVVRGYRSGIDGSVQPYGLVIPAGWKPNDGRKWRLDFWLHGRGEKLSELAFIDERQRNKGEFAPDDAIVCHLYGRYCNANKFAGEIDLFEALGDVRKHYAIDDQRLVVRGFSMGGASTWQFATHHSGMWAAAAPGAGFAETAEFFKSFAPGKTPPPWWEQTLWRWYDCTTMAANLANVPIVAYSGEIDGQKQAADIMLKYARQEGLGFPHIIGPQTAHKYHPEAKPEIEKLVTKAATQGRDPEPMKVRFTTYTMIYPRMEWVEIDGLIKHWERADVNAEVAGAKIVLKTKNVSALHLSSPFAKGLGSDRITSVILDGQTLPATWTKAGLRFHRDGGNWVAGPRTDKALSETKDSGICGPIDHAFMSPFLFVRPTGKPLNDKVGAWSKAELEHALGFWRRTFRGDAPVKDDNAITQEDIETKNLVLFGDPSSNRVFGKMAALGARDTGHTGDPLAIPCQWGKDTLEFNGVKYASANHVPVLIFPNPLNPRKYVVLNSGPTFREEALLNNSDQTPKLPDWAIVNLDTPPDGKWPGQIIDAGFFDEHWALPKK